MKNTIRIQRGWKTLICFIFFIAFSMQSFSQATNYNCTIKNVLVLGLSNISAEIWIENTGLNSLTISGFQAGINFNYSAMVNGGTITASANPGGAISANININPVSKQIRIQSGNTNSIAIIPPSPGIKLCTFLMTNTVPFTASVLPAFTWSFETSSNIKTNTVVVCKVNADPLSKNITIPGNHFVNQIVEICGNSIDDNFNGLIDEGCPPPHAFISNSRPRCYTLNAYSIFAYSSFIPNGLVVFEADAQMVYDPNSTYPAPDNIVGNKYYYHFTGQPLYTLSKLASIGFWLPGPGITICSHIKMNPIDNLGNVDYNTTYQDNLCHTIRCSYDPNEKIVSQPENISIPFDSWLTYTVFFQNTGNDTAYNIHVLDTLDPSLDVFTFKVLESSHPYTSSIDNNHVAAFSFNNINLPDSNINEPGSHGFITYVIKPLPGIINTTYVKNTADIYFDLNSPIRTNTTVNILSDNPCLGILLNDGDSCTVDACNTVTGVTHLPVNIDDGNPCTIDGCNSITGIFHNPATEICGNNIDDNCNGQIDEGCSISLNIKLFIEGFYLGGGTMIATVDRVHHPLLCDTISVELRNPVYPYNVVYFNKNTIDINGSGVFNFPIDALNQMYYIAVHHRNAIETWSASPVLIGSQTLNYFFTTAANKAYGNNLRNLGDGNFALLSGDIIDTETGTPGRQDGVVESSDYGEMENALFFTYLGYMPQDITGDGVVESGDYVLEENNVYYTVFSMHP